MIAVFVSTSRLPKLCYAGSTMSSRLMRLRACAHPSSTTESSGGGLNLGDRRFWRPVGQLFPLPAARTSPLRLFGRMLGRGPSHGDRGSFLRMRSRTTHRLSTAAADPPGRRASWPTARAAAISRTAASASRPFVRDYHGVGTSAHCVCFG